MKKSAPLAQIALDFIEEATSAQDEAAVRDLLLGHCRKLGFDYMIVCDLPLPGQTFRIQLCNWPRSLLDLFRSGLYKHGPIMRHAGRTTEPFGWSEVQWDRSRGSPERRIMDAAAAHQLEDGFVVPVIGLDGDQSCIGLSGRRTRLQDRDRRALHLMCLYAHHAVRRRRLTAPQSGKRTALTRIEHDYLSYAFMGYDPETVAERLALSRAEVNRVARQAARRLAVSRPAEAAVRAAVLEEIRP